MTTRCLAVTGGGSIGKCGKLILSYLLRGLHRLTNYVLLPVPVITGWLYFLLAVSNESERLEPLLSRGFRRGQKLIQASSLCTPTVDFTRSHRSSTAAVSRLGVIELLDQYTEKYLLAHAILNGIANVIHRSSVSSFIFDLSDLSASSENGDGRLFYALLNILFFNSAD